MKIQSRNEIVHYLTYKVPFDKEDDFRGRAFVDGTYAVLSGDYANTVVLALWDGEVWSVDVNKYDPTTTFHQTIVNHALSDMGVIK